MDNGICRLRSQITRLRDGKQPTAVRYPRSVRLKVTAIARRRQAEGADVAAIAREVGVAPWTLALWLRKASPAVMRAVDVVLDAPRPGASAPDGPVLVTPQGIRIEGADVAALATLLRALM
jgi:hypothetical protein